MKFENVFIPYGGYWSSPFVRWQGTLANVHPITLAAQTTLCALQNRNIAADTFAALFLGMTVPQKNSFYGGPWLAALIGAPGITGPVLSQACATGARDRIGGRGDTSGRGTSDPGCHAGSLQ